MLSIATMAARRAIASRRFWLSSTALTSLLLPLWSAPATAQQTCFARSDAAGSRCFRSRVPARRAPPAYDPSRDHQPDQDPHTPRRRRLPQSPRPRPTPPSWSARPRIVTPERNVASSVTVITAADIERDQRRTVPDALSTVPGLNIVQTGGPGGLTSIFMRGTNANHTKVFIDGIDVSDPSNPARVFDFGQLLTADIERIEVLRGPQSGLYGADALGGVISIITKKGEGTDQGHWHGRRRVVRELQPDRQPQRRRRADQLRLHGRTFPHRQHAGDAARVAAARPRADQRHLRELDLLDQARVRADPRDSRSTGWDGIPTRSFCSPAKIFPSSRRCPQARKAFSGSTSSFNAPKPSGRCSTASSPIFRLQLHGSIELEQGARSGRRRRSTWATARGTIGAASYSRFPGRF